MSEFLHQGSLGPIIPQDKLLTFGNEGFRFENGETIPELNIRYETYGTRNADDSNIIWICSPLTADAHVAGFYTKEDKHVGWWDSLIGKGKAIDTDRFFVVCSNILGGCKGTTGPASINPQTGKPYGSAFPKVSIGDMVHAQKALADALGIQRLFAVIGGSMGGFQAMKWAIYYPDFVEHLVIIASSPRFSSQALGFEIVARDVITQDPDFNGGDYYENTKGPATGLANARKLAHITYLSAVGMEQKFKRAADKEKKSHATSAYATPFDMNIPLESYLRYQGAKFVERFDANSYLQIAHATDTFDLENEYGSLENAFAPIQADILNINLSSDWLFPPHESEKLTNAFLRAGKKVTNLEYDTAFGHDGFLIEGSELGRAIHGFLNPTRTFDPQNLSNAYSDNCSLTFLKNSIPQNAKILDLGCGCGDLFAMLQRENNVSGFGIENNAEHIVKCIEKGVPVLQKDLNEGLADFKDNSFDFAILNCTFQEISKQIELLREIFRVAKHAIINFPNFGNWAVRGSLCLCGRMPKSKDLPYEWYNTPNIHLFTLRDFIKLCEQEQLQIEHKMIDNNGLVSKILTTLGFENLGAEKVITVVSKKEF